MENPSPQTIQGGNNRYYDIHITDFQLHVLEPRKPLTLTRSIFKSIRNKEPGRARTTDFEINKEGEITFRFDFSTEDKKRIIEAQNQGKTVRILMPKNGAPIYMGADMIEFLQAQDKETLNRIFGNKTASSLA